MKSGHKNQLRRENAAISYEYSEIPHIGLANVAPLTQEELGEIYDTMIDNSAQLMATRGEFILRALTREMEILEQDFSAQNM